MKNIMEEINSKSNYYRYFDDRSINMSIHTSIINRVGNHLWDNIRANTVSIYRIRRANTVSIYRIRIIR